VVLAGPTEGVEIVGCRFEGAQGIFGMPCLTRRAVIAGNTFQPYPPGRFDMFLLRNPVECIVENNFFKESKRGIVVQPQPRHGMAVHNFFARNVIAHIHRGGNAGETELWEVGEAKGFDLVKSAGADTLTAERVRWEKDEVKGFLCLVVAAAVLSVAYYRLPFWPLHPAGLAVAMTNTVCIDWFSIFLAWGVKAMTLKYGGLSLYRKVLPLFLGLILGSCLGVGTGSVIGSFYHY